MRVRVYVRERVREKERECVCVCVLVCERESPPSRDSQPLTTAQGALLVYVSVYV